MKKIKIIWRERCWTSFSIIFYKFVRFNKYRPVLVKVEKKNKKMLEKKSKKKSSGTYKAEEIR